MSSSLYLNPPSPTSSSSSSVSSSDDPPQPRYPTSPPTHRQPQQRRRQSSIQSIVSWIMKSPLLLRSSPAHGTGSYGALNIMDTPFSESPPRASFDTDADTTDEGHERPQQRRRQSVHATGRTESSGGSNSKSNMSQVRLGKMKSEASLRRKAVASGSYDEIDGSSEALLDEGESSSWQRRRRKRSDATAITIDDEIGNLKQDSEDEEEFNPHNNSPYAQVRASVSNTDDTSLSINTPRMWTLSILFAILGSSTNLFFSLRYPSVSITPVIALLLAHPLGKLWDEIFPNNRERGNFGIRQWLGKGRWNMKEHACVFISSNVSFGFAFATDVIVTQTHFYKQPQSVTYQILLTLSTQILGYTFAGLTRQWLVYPASMIWPATLMSTSMFSTLHDNAKQEEQVKGWENWGRWKLFIVVFIGGFFWYFVPGFLMPSLSYFSVITWFCPKNVVVANLFGVASGLGMFPVTFDWAQISYIGSPLMTPFWAAMNVVAGLVLVMWILAPILYYCNTFYSAFMPILSSSVYDNTGNLYDVSKVLTKDYLFDKDAYEKYSKIFLPITYVLSYGLQFAALTALLSHTAVWHGRDIWRQGTQALHRKSEYTPLSTPNNHRRRKLTDEQWSELIGDEDVHLRLMKRYHEAPSSWYLAIFIISLTVGIFVVEYYPVHLPWYGLLLALSLCLVFFVPIGIVMAITNQQSSIFLICQLVCGTVFPGRPVANMVFITYGYITSTQGLKFASDLKLGHYMKIPPRILFSVQLIATIVGSMTQIGVLNWMFARVPGICTPTALNGFTCPIARVHFNGSILWGVVGPSRFFGRGQLYHPLIYAFGIGLLSPLVIYIMTLYKPHLSQKLRLINLPVLFGSLSWIPPATGLNFSAWAIICYYFNSHIRRRHNSWWRKYTMTLSASLDSSLAVGLVVVFFGILYPGWSWVEGFTWWGTEVYKQGCDWMACSLKQVGEGGRFGPDTW